MFPNTECTRSNVLAWTTNVRNAGRSSPKKKRNSTKRQNMCLLSASFALFRPRKLSSANMKRFANVDLKRVVSASQRLSLNNSQTIWLCVALRQGSAMSARDSFATETGQTTYQKGNAADSRRRMNRQRNNVNCNRKSTARRKKKGSSKKRSSKKLKRWKEGLILQKSRQS